LLLAGVIGFNLYTAKRADQELEEAIAEIDHTDPGWRFEELQAKRAVIPDDQNAALQVLAAKQVLPSPWPRRQSTQPVADEENGPLAETFDLEDSLRKLPPEVQLDARQIQELRAELQQADRARTEARKLAGMPRGRYAINWPLNFIPVIHGAEARVIASLLQWDAFLLAQDKEGDQALASVRGILNTGRSLGDNVNLVAQFVRYSCQAVAANALERVLAQGETSEKALGELQQLLEDEARQPLSVIAIRGERALAHRMMTAYATGELTGSQLPPGQRGTGDVFGDFFYARMMRSTHPSYLRCMTAFVEIARRPMHEQAAAFKQFEAEYQDAPVFVKLLVPALVKSGQSFVRNQAILRCAVTAVAVERYRLAQKRWPESLDELRASLSRELSLDPYDGASLRYRRFKDGVLIYSIGPDGKDNDGVIDRDNPYREGADIGFRLWNPPQRRQPARITFHDKSNGDNE
jgi:hypothetical protein